MRPTVWISKVSLCDSRNFTKICARGQSQPVSIACLKIKNSISLSGSDTQSKVSDFCSDNQMASLPLPVPSFRSVMLLSAKNFLTAFILSSPASAVGICTKTSGLIFAFSFSKSFFNSKRFLYAVCKTTSCESASSSVISSIFSLIINSFLIIPSSITSFGSTKT